MNDIASSETTDVSKKVPMIEDLANDTPMTTVSEPAPVPGPQEDSISFILILRILKRARKTIWTITGVFFALTTVIAFLLPPQYTSVGSILPPNTGANSTGAALAGQLSALGAGGLLGGAVKSPSDLYVGIMKSQSIAAEIVKRFNLKAIYKTKEAKAEEILASNTKFEVGAKDSIIKLSVTDKDPSRARDMAMAYFDILRNTNDRLALSESSQRRLFFEQRLVREKDALEAAEVDLKQTEEHSGLIAPSGQTASEIQTIASTRAQIAQRETELAGLRQYQTEESPDVIRLKGEVVNLQGQLARLQGDQRARPGESIPTSLVPSLQLDFVRKEREVKYHEALFQILAKQYEAARLDEAHDAPILQVLDYPTYPETKSSPHRLLIILGGVVLGFAAGCFWALLKDYLRAIQQA